MFSEVARSVDTARPVSALAAVASSLAVAGLAVTHRSAAAALCLVAVTLLAARAWPSLLWAGALVSSLFLYHALWTTPLLGAGGVTLYASELLPLLLACGALASGIEGLPRSRGIVFTLAAGTAFVLVIAVAAYRTVHLSGATAMLQARHLLPFALAVALPFGRGFRSLGSARIATVLALVASGLAVRSVLLVASGYQARAVPGVQRIFQTWEPFVAAAIGLTLLAYVLSAQTTCVVHYLGLAASAVPVLFGFFRVAWVLTAAIGALLFVVKGERRRGRLLAVALVCLSLLVGVGRLYTGGPTRYERELATRAGQVHLGLDRYRAREYSAVWTEIRKHRLVGSGFGTEYRADWTIYRSWSHNAYEWFWWRVGLLGLAGFLSLLAGALAIGLAAARRLQGDDRALALGLVAGLAFTALAANLHENFENYQTNLFVAFVLAQLIVLRGRVRPEEAD